MRRPGIEPGLVAWEATVLPLDQRRAHDRIGPLHFNVALPGSDHTLQSWCITYVHMTSIFTLYATNR